VTPFFQAQCASVALQFLNQPEGSAGLPETHHRAPFGAITVASTPLDDCDETPKGFDLRRMDGVLWLRGYWSWPGHIWNPEDVLVLSLGAETRPGEVDTYLALRFGCRANGRLETAAYAKERQ
jgi:hypothetical protein